MVASPQINAIVCFRKGKSCEEILRSLNIKATPKNLQILKDAIQTRQVNRTLKKDIEETKSKYQNEFYVLDILKFTTLSKKF